MPLAALGGLGDLAEHLGRSGLVEANRPVSATDRLQEAQGTHAGAVSSEFRHLEADLYVALRPEVVDLVGT